MKTLSAVVVPAILGDIDDKSLVAYKFAYHALTVFIQDCKDLISKSVSTNISNQMESLDQAVSARGLARKQALTQWMKNSNPLSWGAQNNRSSSLEHIILILHETYPSQENAL